MIFSTHRFGNLTRHADLILYVLPVLLVRVDFLIDDRRQIYE